MRAVGYVRVSSSMQVEGHSLDAQERLFRELCKKRGWEAVRIYRDEGRSAHTDAISKRPALRQLLEDAGKGSFDVAVVHTLDRWSRNQRIMLESLATLAKYNVSLVSITENIDYSNPQGKFFTQMLGAIAEYFSGSLGTHVSKGLDQRAREGKHTGGIPFGYESCWTGKKGEKIQTCNPEHPGGIHVHETEGPAVTELFRRYASGTTTLSQLAVWLNDSGFRTRNTKSLPGPDGNLVAGPRLFTTASVRNILHNPFYTGKVIHRGELLPGAHEPLISQDIFDIVQSTLKRNSGRSETLQNRPERHYLLKGIVRCCYCGMPMWAQTYQNGQRYYREHKNSRSNGICPAASGCIPCHIADEQIISLVGNIELGERWLEEVLSIISLKDEVEKVAKRRRVLNEKLRRLARTYNDGLTDDNEYNRQRKAYTMELESLVVPGASAAEEAGKLIFDLPRLWNEANEEEKRKLLLTMLDAVYIDTKNNLIVAVKPKPPFKPVFQVAASRDGSDIRIVNDPVNGSSVFPVESATLPRTKIPLNNGENATDVLKYIVNAHI